MQARLDFHSGGSVGGLDSVSALDAATLPRHRWYFFKEAFSPSVVSCAMEDAHCVGSDLIIDPFGGSGTVPLSAALQGYTSISFEVNPFLAFVSRTKMTQMRRETLERYTSSVLSGVEGGAPSPLESFSTFSPDGGSAKWLFNREVLRAFEGGWQATIGIYPPARDLLRLCLIGAAMDVCNARKDGKCLRYRTNWRQRDYDSLSMIKAFSQRISQVGEDLEISPLPLPKGTEIITGDAREAMRPELESRRFKLCVTSPPYLNSFDYTDVYRPELFLGKFIHDMEDLRSLRLRTLRSHTQVRWKLPQEKDFGPHFSPCYAKIKDREHSLWDRRIPEMIRAYFEDLRGVFRSLKALAHDDASVWMIVSTSAYAGVEIPVDLIAADIGVQEGWYLREINVMRHLRRVPVQQWEQLAEQNDQRKPHLRESVLILDRTA